MKQSVAENKTDLSKKLGYYQLLSLVNSMNCKKKTTEIAVQQGSLAEPKLVIRSLPNKDGKSHMVDVLDAAKKTVDQLSAFDPVKNNGAVLLVSFPRFIRCSKRLLWIIWKILENINLSAVRLKNSVVFGMILWYYP